MTDTSTKKHISVITSEFSKFWESAFLDFMPKYDKRFKDNPDHVFLAKLCYQGYEFSKDPSKREPCLRFFPSELNSGKDLYVECFDWDQNYYSPGVRTLYRLQADEDWAKKPDFYIETTSGGLKTPTYTIRLSSMELINVTPATQLTPVFTIPAEKPATKVVSPIEETLTEVELDEAFSEFEDDHYSKATIRDLYCVIHNVPLSNKKWLNQLIEKGKTWQK